MFWNLFSNAVRFTPSGGSIDVGLFSTFTISIPVQATIPIETLERRARVSLGAPPLIASSLEKILLCDVAMPEQDGYSLIRRIRSKADEKSRVPAVAITAHGRPTEREIALTEGFDEYLKKPVEPHDLISRVVRRGATKRKRHPGLVLAEESVMNAIVVLLVLAAALMLAIGFAFVPMRLLLRHIANNIQMFIVRQRERRVAARGDAGTPRGERESGTGLISERTIS